MSSKKPSAGDQECVVDAADSRARLVADGRAGTGPVIYWMQRETRVEDNWSLLYAQRHALERGRGLEVVFCVAPAFQGAGERQYKFLLCGLSGIPAGLARYGIAFRLLSGDPATEIIRHVREVSACALFADFNPVRVPRGWLQKIAAAGVCPVYEVDAHNIVPCWLASDHAEYGAWTLRPKLLRLLPRFLTEFPALGRQPARLALSGTPRLPLDALPPGLRLDASGAGNALPSGEAAARTRLRDFLATCLDAYPETRADPVVARTSGLSVYLHYGQISAQRVALELTRSRPAGGAAAEAFFEQLYVRRELAENFCFYKTDYDSVHAFPAWSQADLMERNGDIREHVYALDRFEEGATEDALWNAAQRELVDTGTMHGYMRMYWAKKILEWTPSVETALEYAITLNDRWQLDGRDPNGYAGIAWSIGGVHDRPWPRRLVFGRIRYMNAAGCRRKFDVAAYIAGRQRLAGSRAILPTEI